MSNAVSNATLTTKRPMKLTDIRGQDLVVNMLTWALVNNDIPVAYLAHGPGGVGKTSTISAFVRTLLCLNRPPGGADPCLECASCKALTDPRDCKHPNVVWVQVGKGASRGEDSLNSQVNQALEAAKVGPVYADEPHRSYKIIVVDEVQNLPVNQLQRFLYLPEAVNQINTNNVRIIFSTMNRHRLNADTVASFVGRCTELPFEEPGYEDLLAVAETVAPNAPKMMLMQICDHVSRYGGAYRQLIEYLDTFSKPHINFHPTLVRRYLGILSLEEVDHFWYLCSLCKPEGRGYEDAKNFYNHLLRLCRREPVLLYERLAESLEVILGLPGATTAHYEALRALTMAATSRPYPNDWVLKLLYGLPYVPLIEH